MKMYQIFDLSLYLRTFIVTIYALFLFRTSSPRLLGQYSPLDLVIIIVIGALLGTAIADGLPLSSSMICSGLIVGIHRSLMAIATKSSFLEHFIKGEKKLIIARGKFIKKNLQHAQLSVDDIMQSLRAQKGELDIQNVYRSFLEADGSISFIMKENN